MTGNPDALPRVVTLIARAGSPCWGAAYLLEDPGILEQLDHREQAGYERHQVDLGLRAGSAVRGLTYVATAENANYLGPAPLDEIAEQVRRSAGPSGPNLEYVRRLADALRRLGAADPHVFALDRLLDEAEAVPDVPGGDQVRPPSLPKS